MTQAASSLPTLVPVAADAACGRLVAAIDVGSTNCRMTLGRVEEDGDIHVVQRFSRITRLAEGLGPRGALGVPAMDRTLGVLHQCAGILRRRQVTRVRAVTTEACRQARNAEAFLARIQRQTGLRVERIDAREEARLALAGCAPLLDAVPDRALVFDIGGASSEIMWVDVSTHGIRLLETQSLPLGVISLTEMPLSYDGKVAHVAEALHAVDALFGVADGVSLGRVQMLGISGTVTTLAGIHLGLRRYDRRRVDGQTLSFTALDAATDRVRRLTHAQRCRHPCVGRDRADYLLAGCAILDAIRQQWPVGCLRVADRGVREGLLYDLARGALTRETAS